MTSISETTKAIFMFKKKTNKKQRVVIDFDRVISSLDRVVSDLD